MTNIKTFTSTSLTCLLMVLVGILAVLPSCAGQESAASLKATTSAKPTANPGETTPDYTDISP